MPILRTRQAIADYLGVSPPTVDSWVEKGLPATRIGRAWLTSTDLIDQWILSRHLGDVVAKRETRVLKRLRRAAAQRVLSDERAPHER